MVTVLIPVTNVVPTENGIIREIWIKASGLTGLVSAATPTVVNALQNPFNDDLVIVGASLYVATASGAVATDMDIGLADDAAGTNIGAELADGLVAATLDAVGVKELGAVHAIGAPPAEVIWKAKGAATDSYVATIQRGNLDAHTLVANLLLRCIKVTDIS